MPESKSLKRNTDNEVLPQGYSTELADWKEVIVDEEGKQYVRDTEVLAKLTEMDNKLQTLEDTVDTEGNQKVTLKGNIDSKNFTHLEIGENEGEIEPGQSIIIDRFAVGGHEYFRASAYSEQLDRSISLHIDGFLSVSATNVGDRYFKNEKQFQHFENDTRAHMIEKITIIEAPAEADATIRIQLKNTGDSLVKIWNFVLERVV